MGEATIYRIGGTGHGGSRSMGCGWWVRLVDGRYLREDQSGSSWPPYPVIAVERVLARPVKTKREAQAMLDRYRQPTPASTGKESDA